MIRPGYLSKASISIDGEFPCRSGSKLKGLDGSGRCGVEFGIGGGVMVLVGFYFISLKEVNESAPDGFVEIPAQRIIAEELNGNSRRADEGSKIPGELRAKEKIAD